MKTPLTKKRDFNKWREKKISIVKLKTTKIAYLNLCHKEVKQKKNTNERERKWDANKSKSDKNDNRFKNNRSSMTLAYGCGNQMEK